MKEYFVYVERVLHSDYNVTKSALGFIVFISDCYVNEIDKVKLIIQNTMDKEFGKLPVDQVEVIKQLNRI